MPSAPRSVFQIKYCVLHNTLYKECMIKSFKHKGLRNFFETGSHSGIHVNHIINKKIKARNPEKPCIIMSGMSEYKKAARDLNADGFLSEPFPVSDLFKMVGQFA